MPGYCIRVKNPRAGSLIGILFTALLVSNFQGVFHNGAIILLTTSHCQSLCLRPDGSCSGAGNPSDDSYWRVHKISSGVCMFESVQNPQMYLRIKDGQCNGRVSSSYSYFSENVK